MIGREAFGAKDCAPCAIGLGGSGISQSRAGANEECKQKAAAKDRVTQPATADPALRWGIQPATHMRLRIPRVDPKDAG
jgi:hypothetical protein